MENNTDKRPQVKICGLTEVEKALACAELGADAIGLVFYPESPRCVSEETAKDIAQALPATTIAVGVFVDDPFEKIMGIVKRCGLGAVQLAGQESPDMVDLFVRDGIPVFKGLFHSRKPGFEAADAYNATAFIVEGGKGKMPGGNAEEWDWSAAGKIRESRPVILAGGLDPENIAQAVTRARPDAVDVSSGVEAAPGQKDIGKVKAFLEALSQADFAYPKRRIFQ